MKRPTTQRSSGTEVDNIAADDDFVNIDLNSYEKDVGVCEVAEQEPVFRPVGGLKTRLVILILILLFLGTASVIVALFFHLSRNQKLYAAPPYIKSTMITVNKLIVHACSVFPLPCASGLSTSSHYKLSDMLR